MKKIVSLIVISLVFSVFAQSPKIYSNDGKYLGNLNNNKFDPNSVSNPFGKYGSPFSPDSINNPYGKYGSPFSPESVTNPFAVQPIQPLQIPNLNSDPWE